MSQAPWPFARLLQNRNCVVVKSAHQHTDTNNDSGAGVATKLTEGKEARECYER